MTTQIKFTTAEEAVKVIKSGDHVHLSSVASAPQCLINAMCARGEAGELKDVHIHHGSDAGTLNANNNPVTTAEKSPIVLSCLEIF